MRPLLLGTAVVLLENTRSWSKSIHNDVRNNETMTTTTRKTLETNKVVDAPVADPSAEQLATATKRTSARQYRLMPQISRA